MDLFICVYNPVQDTTPHVRQFGDDAGQCKVIFSCNYTNAERRVCRSLSFINV